MPDANRQAEEPIVRLYPQRTAGQIGWLSLGLFMGPLLLEVSFKQLGYVGE